MRLSVCLKQNERERERESSHTIQYVQSKTSTANAINTSCGQETVFKEKGCVYVVIHFILSICFTLSHSINFSPCSLSLALYFSPNCSPASSFFFSCVKCCCRDKDKVIWIKSKSNSTKIDIDLIITWHYSIENGLCCCCFFVCVVQLWYG